MLRCYNKTPEEKKPPKKNTDCSGEMQEKETQKEATSANHIQIHYEHHGQMTYKDKGIRYNRNGMLVPGLM